MAFTSALYPGEMIIDESTPEADYTPDEHARGLKPRPRGVGPDDYAYEGIADPFPSELLVPESEIIDRIKEAEERKTRVSDLVTLAGLPCKDQDGIPYCWIHGPTHALEVTRVVQNEPVVLLSATSAGARIKNFRKQGGWGKEGLQWLSDNGVNTQAEWPENNLSRSLDTAASRESAKKYRATEWWELRPRNWHQHMSCLIRRIPIAVGLNYWAHEVCDYELVVLDGEICVRFRNSWTMNWPTQGAGGYSIRRGNKKFADDAVAPRVATSL